MWGLASNAIAGCFGPRNTHKKQIQLDPDCSDGENSCVSGEGLECPICFESFNIVENVPYVLWCGHTLCKNCVLGLQWAFVKFATDPVQLPLFISCPWCHLLSFRLVYKGVLKFPRKNFFLLWMVESMNGDRTKSNLCGSRDRGNHNHNQTSGRMQHQTSSDISSSENSTVIAGRLSREIMQASLRRLLALFASLSAKIPLVIICVVIIVYAIPASAVVLVLYVLLTIVFALPSCFVLYFAYPSLDWLVREILT